MNTDRDYLAAGLALGGLSADDLAEARALADSDADFRTEVAAYEDTVALMALSDEPQPVSESTRDAILAIPSTTEQESARDDADVPVPVPVGARQDEPGEPIELDQHRRKRNWLPWAAAAAAIVVIAGFGVSSWQMQQRQGALEDTLASTQQQLDETTRLMSADDLRTTTAELADGGTVTVVSSQAEQLIHVSSRGVQAAQGTSLQMWLIDDDGPKSAGLMEGAATNIAGSVFTAGSQFGITVEPEGGSPQPTTEPVVAVAL